jgi:cobalt/nickel transport system permease protein
MIGGQRGILIGAMAASWFSVILASGAFSIELAASGKYSFLQILGWMTLVHAAIGLGEALITGMFVRFVLLVKPELIDPSSPIESSKAAQSGRFALGLLGIALALAIFLAPLASEKPDGLEYVGTEKVKFLPTEGNAPAPILPAPIPDYEMPGLSRSKSVATAAAGVVGTLVVFGVGMVLARTVDLGKPKAARLDLEWDHLDAV